MKYKVHSICSYIERNDGNADHIHLPGFEMKGAFNENIIFEWILKNIPTDSIIINTWCDISYVDEGANNSESVILTEFRYYDVYRNVFELNRFDIRNPMTDYDDVLFRWDSTRDYTSM